MCSDFAWSTRNAGTAGRARWIHRRAYAGINGLPLANDQVRATMHPAIISCIEDCLYGRN